MSWIVHQEDVDSVEHLRRWTAHRAVQRMDGYARLDVDVVLDRFSRVGGASDSVLRREEGHEFHGRMFMNPIDRGATRAVHAGLIGDQPDVAARHQMERVF